MILTRAFCHSTHYNLEACALYIVAFHSMVQGGVLQYLCSMFDKCIYQKGAENETTKTWHERMHIFVRLHLHLGEFWLRGSFARCVEPLPLSWGSSVSLGCALRFPSDLEPGCLFLKASAICLVASSRLPMSLGTKFSSISMSLCWCWKYTHQGGDCEHIVHLCLVFCDERLSTLAFYFYFPFLSFASAILTGTLRCVKRRVPWLVLCRCRAADLEVDGEVKIE